MLETTEARSSWVPRKSSPARLPAWLGHDPAALVRAGSLGAAPAEGGAEGGGGADISNLGPAIG